jgi:hypothetical protein
MESITSMKSSNHQRMLKIVSEIDMKKKKKYEKEFNKNQRLVKMKQKNINIK